MKKFSAVLLVGLLLNVSQHLQAQIKVEKGKTITIEILNVSNEPPPSSSKLDIVNAPSLTACNMQVRRGSEKTDVKIDPKNNKGIYEFEGRELGQETISWEGKTKFRGFNTLRACYTNGQLSVETIESAEIRQAKLAAQKKGDEEERAREEARVAQKKADEVERAREEARVAQKKADEEERKLGEAKLAAQKADKEAKQVKAAMDKQAKRLKELEAKLKIAEAEAAKTPEQKEKEARIAAEAKASAEAKVAAKMKEEKRKSALEEVRASRKMKVEERKIALENIRALKEKKAKLEERARAEAKLAAQKKAKAKEEGRKREQAKLAAQNKAKVEEREIALEEVRVSREWKAKEEEREREWKRREAQLKAEAPAKARAARESRARAERRAAEAKKNKQLQKSNFVQGMEYTFFSDGSCRSGIDRYCLNINEYKQICNLATSFSLNVRRGLAVYTSPSDFIRSGGTFNSLRIAWTEERGRCIGVFSISGLLNGTSVNKEFGGYAKVFVVDSRGEILVHYVDTLGD
ncbi:hypothetical protein ABXT54_02570 [Methylophilaceae bacterium Uisw_099_01]